MELDPLAAVTFLVAMVVLERPDGSVLLARRSGVSYGDGLWGLPGGHVEGAESWPAAAVREVREEVGIEIDERDLVPVGMWRYLDGAHHGIDLYFRARRWAGEPQPVSECSEVGWFWPDRLPADSLAWLPAALAKHLIAGVWFDESGF